MKILLLVFGKTDESYVIEGIKKFEKKIKPFIQLEIEEIAEPKNHCKLAKPQQLNNEAIIFKSKLKSSDEVVLLDEKGKQFSSVEFSQKIESLLNSTKKRIVFIVGGPYGISENLKNEFKNQISLSKMTFTHQLVRLFFVEQVYRSFTIINKMPYHHI